MTNSILEFAGERVARGGLVALVTVTKTRGSSPASPGQLMAVSPDGKTAGTVGGGATEHRLINRAVEAMQSGERVFDFSVEHDECGMVCGGAMSGFCNILGSENRVYLFGAGHVGQALAKAASLTGFNVSVVDDRAALESEFSGVDYISCPPESYSEQLRLTHNAYAVICTRGHETDEEALRFCLAHELKYIGMVGSAKKINTLFSKLAQEGYNEEKLRAVYTPIGLDIANTIPAEIAISVMAEILLVKNEGSPGHRRDKYLENNLFQHAPKK